MGNDGLKILLILSVVPAIHCLLEELNILPGETFVLRYNLNFNSTIVVTWSSTINIYFQIVESQQKFIKLNETLEFYGDGMIDYTFKTESSCDYFVIWYNPNLVVRAAGEIYLLASEASEYSITFSQQEEIVQLLWGVEKIQFSTGVGVFSNNLDISDIGQTDMWEVSRLAFLMVNKSGEIPLWLEFQNWLKQQNESFPSENLLSLMEKFLEVNPEYEKDVGIQRECNNVKRFSFFRVSFQVKESFNSSYWIDFVDKRNQLYPKANILLVLPKTSLLIDNIMSFDDRSKKLDGKVVASMAVSIGIIVCGVILCTISEIRRRIKEERKSVVHLPLIID